MKRVTSFLLLCITAVISYPADHREDTVLPFSLSPGNVNLETYYLDKYPKPGPGGSLNREQPKYSSSNDGNGVQEETPNDHAIFRSRPRRSPRSDHVYDGRGRYHNGGQYHMNSPPSYGHHHQNQYPLVSGHHHQQPQHHHHHHNPHPQPQHHHHHHHSG